MHKTLRRNARKNDRPDDSRGAGPGWRTPTPGPAHGRAVQTRGFIVTDAVDQGLEIMVIVYFCLKFK
jgi:hypothetical protein